MVCSPLFAIQHACPTAEEALGKVYLPATKQNDRPVLITLSLRTSHLQNAGHAIRVYVPYIVLPRRFGELKPVEELVTSLVSL